MGRRSAGDVAHAHAAALLGREEIPPVSLPTEAEEESVRLPPGRPFGTVTYFAMRDDQLVARLPGGAELTPDDPEFHERFDKQGLRAQLLARWNAAGIGVRDSERTPEQRREFRRQVSIGRRHNTRVRRARLLLSIVRVGRGRLRSRARRQRQAGKRGRCRGPDDPGGSEPPDDPDLLLGELPQLFTFEQHHRDHADASPAELLALALALPEWVQGEAWADIARRAELAHDEAAS